MSESNYPVMIGLAQLIQREEDPALALGPLEMLVKIAEDAAADSGVGPAAINAIDTIGIVDVAAWRPQNVARLVGDVALEIGQGVTDGGMCAVSTEIHHLGVAKHIRE